MRVLFKVLMLIGLIWVLLNLMWAGLAVASGHNVPTSTFLGIAGFASIGVVVIIGSIIGLRKVKK